MSLQSVRASPGTLGVASVSGTLPPPGLSGNAEYRSFQSLATVAPVPYSSRPVAIAPAAPYTTQFSNGTTAAGTTPVADLYVPAAVQSPTSLASVPDPITTASTNTDNSLAQLLQSLSGGPNVSNGQPGFGVGQYSNTLPPTSAADVASLQPAAGVTSNSGPSLTLIVGLIGIAGVGIYFYMKHKKGSS